jgi:hypothetical protein
VIGNLFPLKDRPILSTSSERTLSAIESIFLLLDPVDGTTLTSGTEMITLVDRDGQSIELKARKTLTCSL